MKDRINKVRLVVNVDEPAVVVSEVVYDKISMEVAVELRNIGDILEQYVSKGGGDADGYVSPAGTEALVHDLFSGFHPVKARMNVVSTSVDAADVIINIESSAGISSKDRDVEMLLMRKIIWRIFNKFINEFV